MTASINTHPGRQVATILQLLAPDVAKIVFKATKYGFPFPSTSTHVLEAESEVFLDCLPDHLIAMVPALQADIAKVMNKPAPAVVPPTAAPAACAPPTTPPAAPPPYIPPTVAASPVAAAPTIVSERRKLVKSPLLQCATQAEEVEAMVFLHSCIAQQRKSLEETGEFVWPSVSLSKPDGRQLLYICNFEFDPGSESGQQTSTAMQFAGNPHVSTGTLDQQVLSFVRMLKNPGHPTGSLLVRSNKRTTIGADGFAAYVRIAFPEPGFRTWIGVRSVKVDQNTQKNEQNNKYYLRRGVKETGYSYEPVRFAAYLASAIAQAALPREE